MTTVEFSNNTQDDGFESELVMFFNKEMFLHM